MSFLEQMSAQVLRFVSSATLDSRARVSSPEVEAAILRARERATYEMVPVAMIAEGVTTLAVYWVLHNRLPDSGLFWWLVAREAIALVRLAHGIACLRGHIPSGPATLRSFVAMAFIDGVAWSALGWWFTPVFRLDVAVVTIGVLTGVASVGVLMLQTTMSGVLAFALPILVPNAFFAIGRHDDLGYFCTASVLGLMVMMMNEAARSNRRIIEMLRLRFESEQASEAKTEALRQAKLLADTKNRFVATMSHEMRTPLHGILGLVRLVREAAHDAKSACNLALIQSSGEHLLSVINDVLDFSRLEAGGLTAHVQPFGINDVLHELAETSRVLCTEKGLALDVQIALPPGEYVLGDPTRVKQVLHNLIGNAVKFTLKGTVGLHAWRDESSGMLMFEVRDTGIGIPKHELPRVFEAFHQAEGTYERRFGGTGLGLTISRDLCRTMGGDLACKSEQGRGSVFTCSLPLPRVAAPELATRPKARTPRLSDSPLAFDLSVLDEPHVLVVEDNAVNALVAQAELQRFGVRVSLVDNGQDAITCLEREQVDLVLMDCEMPGMDGIETTRRIRERERMAGRAAVSIVALTANGADVYAERCVPVGMNGHLLKPFKPEELAKVLSNHLRTALCVS
jgi:signal transduction histidine kinase/ActR/RegA family two-component response regulator